MTLFKVCVEFVRRIVLSLEFALALLVYWLWSVKWIALDVFGRKLLENVKVIWAVPSIMAALFGTLTIYHSKRLLSPVDEDVAGAVVNWAKFWKIKTRLRIALMMCALTLAGTVATILFASDLSGLSFAALIVAFAAVFLSSIASVHLAGEKIEEIVNRIRGKRRDSI